MEGKFTCQFPGDPKEQNISLNTLAGEVRTHAFTFQPDVQTAYGVDYTDYPEAIKFQSNALDKAMSAVVDKASGKVVFQQDMTFENYPAREFEYVAGGKANYSGRVKTIIADQRVYQLVTVFLTDNPHPEDRAFFFRSFKIQK